MPKPPDDFENLQTVYQRVYNKLVKESFREDIPDDDFATHESQMRYACLIKDTDSATMMLLKSNMFFVIREEAKRFHPPHYELPIYEWDSVVSRPQILMRFQESKSDARQHHRQPKIIRVSFRLMDETSETLTQAKVDQLKHRIPIQFPRNYQFKTGRYKMSYRDKTKGYELVITPHSTAIGEKLIEKVLAIGSDTPDWEKMSVSQAPRRNYDATQRVRILNESHTLPHRRAIADLILKRVVLKVHGGLADIPLYEVP